MSLFDALFDGATHAHARRGRELAALNGQTQARGFNMILSKLDDLSTRIEHLESEVHALRTQRYPAD